MSTELRSGPSGMGPCRWWAECIQCGWRWPDGGYTPAAIASAVGADHRCSDEEAAGG